MANSQVISIWNILSSPVSSLSIIYLCITIYPLSYKFTGGAATPANKDYQLHE